MQLSLFAVLHKPGMQTTGGFVGFGPPDIADTPLTVPEGSALDLSASSSNKHNFLAFYALRTITDVSASLCSFFMYVFKLWNHP